MSFKPWDIVAVPFPFADSETEKRRPALVISNNGLADDHDLYWLVMITSAKNKKWKGDIAIADHEATGLPAPSLIRPAKLATLQQNMIIRRVGKLEKSQQRAVTKALQNYLAS